jgi:hypothetical protein
MLGVFIKVTKLISQVDLNSGIDAILTASYSNDYSFHVGQSCYKNQYLVYS